MEEGQELDKLTSSLSSDGQASDVMIRETSIPCGPSSNAPRWWIASKPLWQRQFYNHCCHSLLTACDWWTWGWSYWTPYILYCCVIYAPNLLCVLRLLFERRANAKSAIVGWRGIAGKTNDWGKELEGGAGYSSSPLNFFFLSVALVSL